MAARLARSVAAEAWIDAICDKTQHVTRPAWTRRKLPRIAVILPNPCEFGRESTSEFSQGRGGEGTIGSSTTSSLFALSEYLCPQQGNGRNSFLPLTGVLLQSVNLRRTKKGHRNTPGHVHTAVKPRHSGNTTLGTCLGCEALGAAQCLCDLTQLAP